MWQTYPPKTSSPRKSEELVFFGRSPMVFIFMSLSHRGGLIGLIINYDDPSKIRPGYSVAKQGIHTLSSPVRVSNSIEALCQPMGPGPSRPSRKCNSALKLEIPSQNPGLNLPYTSYKLPLSNYNGQSNGNRFVQFVGLRGGRVRPPWFFLPFCAGYGILIIKIRLVCACSAGKKKG